MVLDDEANLPQDLPSCLVPFKLVDKPESVPLDISEDEDIDHSGNPTSSHIDRLLDQGFEGEEDFALLLKSYPLMPFQRTLQLLMLIVLSLLLPHLLRLLLPHLLLFLVKRLALLAREET